MKERGKLRMLNCVCDYCDVTLAKDDGLKEEEMKENEHLRMCTCERWQVERWKDGKWLQINQGMENLRIII